MQSFAEQCIDMARSILGHNIEAINEDGTITPVAGEQSLPYESGHAALAIGEFFRATKQTELNGKDLVDLCARCVTAQAFMEEESENGLAYASLGLLSFGPAKERNLVWERFVEQTQERLDRRLLARTDYDDHYQAFNVAKAVARFSMGLSKKDETSRLIERFIERIQSNSSQWYCDDYPHNLGGAFNVYGVMSFVFIRQALQLHADSKVKERKLPSLRTYAEKYLKLIPDMVRDDGLGWAYGSSIGAYGQMHCISLILQAMRDGWITVDQQSKYFDVLRRLFQFFFLTYLDQEHGVLVIRDAERDTVDGHSTRMANFDAARSLCQWSRLALTIGNIPQVQRPVSSNKATGRYVLFDKSSKKEQGLFIYQDPNSGLHVQLPLVSSGKTVSSDSLAFPHCPGIFDWPVNKYLPVLVPELTFGENVIVPSFYGMRCTTKLGLRNSFDFRYEQSELINIAENIIPGLGSCKVNWSFCGNTITSEFMFSVKNQVQLDRMRYVIAIAAPHSQYRLGSSLMIGEKGLGAQVLKDDFMAEWKDTEVVSDDPQYKTYYGKVHYIQVLERNHPLIMRPGQVYTLKVSFTPDISMADA